MDHWKSLFDKFNREESVRVEKQRRALDEAEARRSFDAWCSAATEQVMTAVCESAREHAVEFQSHTGCPVLVQYPSRRPLDMEPDGAHITFLRLELRGSRVEFYAHRGPGLLPFFHFVHTHADAQHKRMNRVVASLPACYAARLADGRWELRRAGPAPAPGSASDLVSVEELVFRAFELLIECLDALPVVPPPSNEHAPVWQGPGRAAMS